MVNKSKRYIADVVSVILIVLNLVSIVNTVMFSDKLYRITNIFEGIIAGLFMYATFIMPISIVVGLIVNLKSVIRKKRSAEKFTINIIYMLIFVLTIPIWYKFWTIALMSV